MKRPKKLRGGPTFDVLMGKLAQVPKKEADRAAREWKKSRAKKRKSDGGG